MFFDTFTTEYKVLDRTGFVLQAQCVGTRDDLLSLGVFWQSAESIFFRCGRWNGGDGPRHYSDEHQYAHKEYKWTGDE